MELSRSKKIQLPDAPDGRKRYAINASLDVLQMKEDGGDWEDIDTTLNNKGIPAKVPYELTPYLNGLPGFHYKSKNSGEYDVRLKEARQDSINPTIISPKPNCKPVIEGRTITWPDLYPDVDVVLTAFNTGMSLNRIIKSLSAPFEYDVTITEVEKGVAQLIPLKPATDAEGQLIKMEEKPTLDGRTETLKLEVISEEPKPITYPIKDSTIIDDQPVAASTDDAWQAEQSGAMWLTADEVYIYTYSTAEWRYWGGMRWEVAISQGSTIDTCYCNLNVFSADDPDCNLHFEYAAAPGTFTSTAFNLTGRTRTSSSASWVASNIGTGWKTTPSMVDELQEVVDDFTTEYVVFIGRPNQVNTRSIRFHSWDYDDHSLAPQIYIEYTEAASEQELTAATVGSASSVSSSAISGSGNAPLTQAIVAVASSVSVASIAGSGNAPLTSSPIAVISSVEASSISGSSNAPLTQAVIGVVSSVINAVLSHETQYLTSSPIALTSSVEASAIVGLGTALLTAGVVSATSSVPASSITQFSIYTLPAEDIEDEYATLVGRVVSVGAV